MKTAKSILENTAHSTKPPPRPSNRININEKLINRLFVRFGAIYPHIWKSQFNNNKQSVDVAKIEWGMALTKFTPMQIGSTIERCIDVFELPPTIPQFVNLCKAECRSLRNNSQQLYQPLPSLSVEPEVAHERLKNIMANLKTKTQDGDLG